MSKKQKIVSEEDIKNIVKKYESFEKHQTFSDNNITKMIWFSQHFHSEIGNKYNLTRQEIKEVLFKYYRIKKNDR